MLSYSPECVSRQSDITVNHKCCDLSWTLRTSSSCPLATSVKDNLYECFSMLKTTSKGYIWNRNWVREALVELVWSWCGIGDTIKCYRNGWPNVRASRSLGWVSICWSHLIGKENKTQNQLSAFMKVCSLELKPCCNFIQDRWVI